MAPITEKETHRGVTEDGMEFAVSSMQGWRVHMEDAHITEGILYAEEPIIEEQEKDETSQEISSVRGSNDNNAVDADTGGEPVNHHLSKKAKTSENTGNENGSTCTATSNDNEEDKQDLQNEIDGDANDKKEEAESSPSPSVTSTSTTSYPSPSSSNSNTNTNSTNVVKYNRIKLEGHSLFSVFDGHGGSFAAEYAGLNFARVLSRQPAFVKYAHFIEDLTTREAMNKTVSATSSTEAADGDENEKALSPFEKSQLLREGLELLEEALKDAFLDLDREIWREVQGYGNADGILPEKNKGKDDGDGQQNSGNDEDADEAMPHHDPSDEEEWQQKQDSGTTAVAVLITPQWIICSNAGDSRSVYSKQGNCTIPLSYDHKPDDEAEERRIYDAGGFVRGGRVEGDLAVSRGLGDFRFKEDDIYRSMGVSPVSFSRYSDTNGRKLGGGNVTSPSEQKVSPLPDIIVQNRDLENDEFVVLACDGIFDVQSNHECVALTADIMRGGEGDLGLVCEEVSLRRVTDS